MLFGSHEKSLIFHGEGGNKSNSDGGSGEKGSSGACGGVDSNYGNTSRIKQFLSALGSQSLKVLLRRGGSSGFSPFGLDTLVPHRLSNPPTHGL